MTFQLTEPILIIGLGGVGTRLAEKTKKTLNSDCLMISHDQKDLTAENSIKIPTKSVVIIVSTATLESVSPFRNSSRIASEILSQTLSGWPSVTDSEVKR